MRLKMVQQPDLLLIRPINIPKMQVPNPPPFTPIGGNAAEIKDFTVGQPFTGNYLVVYRHYFKFK